MRLFLASQNFGNHVDKLQEMVGSHSRALVIFNQRDYEMPANRQAVVERKRQLFEQHGFEFQELDLRDFFGQKDRLRQFITAYQPDLIAATGGNPFLLKSAFNQSGFSEILQEDLAADRYVYAGYSAGAMVVAPDYHHYDIGDKPAVVRTVYGIRPDYKGLGLISEYILPHADQEWYRADFAANLQNMRAHGIEPIILHDSDVLVVNGQQQEVLR